MGTINSALSITRDALNAEQAALNIVANNVANASTTGYTRQIATFEENPSILIGGVSFGSGVTETGATSVRDSVLEKRLAQQQQLASASSARLAALQTLETQFPPVTGTTTSTAGDIGSDLTSFFNSFTSLEASPTNESTRQQVLSTAQALAGDLSQAAFSLNTQRTEIDQEATGAVSQINSLVTAIAQLNHQIQSASTSGDEGTLVDQRQVDISQLSQLIGINQVTTENGGLSLTTTSGQLLVSQDKSYPITSGVSGGMTQFYIGDTNVTTQLTSGGGQLGGYLTARDVDIPNVLASLDQLAYNVTTAVNDQNNAGLDANGNTGTVTDATTGARSLDIFSPSPTYAANLADGTSNVAGAALAMKVVMTDPNSVAAAGTGQGTGGNANALAMSALASQQIVSGQTPSNFYSSFISSLGATISGVEAENTAQTASVTQLQSQRNALSAVNLNDEASSLTTFERSYQAASQVFAIINNMMASALNLGTETAVS